MNVLLIKLSSIGDVVHTLPTLAEIRRLHPKAHITWLVEEEAHDIIRGNPYINRIIVSKRKIWQKNLSNPSMLLRTLKEVSHFIREIRDTSYDLVIDLQGLFKSGILVYLTRGERKVGYDKTRELSYLFLNERIKPFHPDQHAVLRYINLAKYLGANGTHLDFGIPVGETEKEYIDRIINVSKKPIIAINPMARWKTKQWNHGKFAELADKIHHQLDAMVIFTGSKDHIIDVARILSYMESEAINLVGKTTLKQLAHLFKHSKLVVSTDSGPMHIAAAVGTRVIALFGPTSPSRTGPFGEGHVIIRKDLPCSPCLKRSCPTLECMDSISVEDVFSKIRAAFSP